MQTSLDQNLDTREPETKPFSNSLKRNENTFLCVFYWTKDPQQSGYRLKDANTWISKLDAGSLSNALSILRNYYQVSLEWASSLLRRNAASRLPHSFHGSFLQEFGTRLRFHHRYQQFSLVKSKLLKCKIQHWGRLSDGTFSRYFFPICHIRFCNCCGSDSQRHIS